MSDDERDPIIDSLLEEVLGGQQPPDLTEQILSALRAQSELDSTSESESESAGVAPSSVENRPEIKIDAKPQPRKKLDRTRDRARGSNINTWASAAVVLIGAGLFAVWAVQQTNKFRAENSLPPVVRPADDPRLADAKPKITIDPLAGQSETPIDELPQRPSWLDPKIVKDKMRRERKGGGSLASSETPNNTQTQLVDAEVPQFRRTAELDRPSSNSAVVAYINKRLKLGWSDAKVAPTPSVVDLTWFHRASQTLLGRAPTPEEQQQFRDSRDREETLSRLLAHQEFASHWASVFADVLIGDLPTANRISLETFLAESIQQNKPFDQLAFELITAQGSGQQGTENYNPAANFLLAHQQENSRDPAAVTDKVCQVFLGKQMQCVRCHDHPARENDIAQQQYWELASYFAQTQVGSANGVRQLVNADFGGSTGNSFDQAELFYNRADQVGSVAFPKFFDQELANKSGRVADVNRRVELANKIVSSDDFAKATMNRLWRKVFFTGFTRPVDDMGEHNPPSHERLLSKLGTEFRNSEFDIRSAMRWMLMSSAFDRKVRMNSVRPDNFSSFAKRESVSYPKIGPAVLQLAKARGAGRKFDPTELLANIGSDGETKLTREQQSAELRRIAGQYTERLLSTEQGSLLLRMAKNHKLTNEQRVEHLFYALVGRAPTNLEMTNGTKLLDSTSKLKALQEIGWIVINSKEFQSQH